MANSRSALDDLLQQAQGPLLGYLIRLTGSVHVAQDLLQSANVTVIEKQASFAPGTHFIAWMRQIALNHYRNHVRKQASFQTEVLVDDRLHEVIERRHRQRMDQQRQESDWQRLQDCLRNLPSHQQAIVQRFYLDGQSLSELADATGRNANAIGQTLHRARLTLMECVKFSGEETPPVTNAWERASEQGAELP
ncbi:sigma-70 family RNA polymerase sigma factor [Rosistilla carotiformis]|uniref:sigma-70 family RNA polymerase sigma factor n=1 Tax=Rosistilla carotiformis TaxID=2528017 RepID=UPI001E60F15A|nr:sigma-70 family RNA polymerase sigma factor [Rosistilla carotiformis]